jgi:hypothetical protein
MQQSRRQAERAAHAHAQAVMDERAQARLRAYADEFPHLIGPDREARRH